MPAKISVPDSLSSLLQHFRSCFSAPGYEVFTAMFTGFILRPVERTVCGMLTGAGLAGVWHHSRAHRFFANTRWDVREVGLILATLWSTGRASAFSVLDGVLAAQDQCDGVGGGSGVVSEGRGDVGGAAESDEVDGEVADAGHDLGSVAGSGLGVVFAVGDITDPMQACLDGPVPAEPGLEVVRSGVFGREVGDGVHGFGGPFLAFQLAAFPGDLDGLTGVWESDTGSDSDDLEGSSLFASVGAVVLDIGDRDLGPGQRCQLAVQGWLVPFHGQ